MIPSYSTIIPQDLRISSPPGIEPGISCLGVIPLATMLYRRGLCSCSAGKTGGVVLSHGASQPSPGLKPPPVGWEPRRMPFNYGDVTGLYASGGQGLICIAFGGCRGTRQAPSTTAKARGAIWIITCGTVLCQCACGVFQWVLCQWLSHRARESAGLKPAACMAPPSKRRTRRSRCCERLTEQVAESGHTHCCRGRW